MLCEQIQQAKARMQNGSDEDSWIYQVVVNHEEQYSIWRADREVPAGWVAIGKAGPKAECLSHIEKTWIDMRPLSLRKHMEAFEVSQGTAFESQGNGVGEVTSHGTTDPAAP